MAGVTLEECKSNITGSIGNNFQNSMSNLTELERLIVEGKIRPLTHAGYIGTAVYLVFIGISATAGNGMMLSVFYRNRKLLKNPHNQLLLNLVLSDLGISLFGYPWTTSSNFAGRYLYGKVGCVVQGFLTFTFAQTDMNTLAILSFYRYVAVCMPGDAHRLTTSFTVRVIALLWIYSLLWTVPPLIGWSAYTYEPFGTSCSIDWDDTETGAVAYTWCLVFYCYIVHIIIMAYCYYHIAFKAQEVHRKLKNFRLGGVNNRDTQCLIRIQMERKTTLMAIILTVIFVLVWSPYVFVCLWSVYDPNLPNWITTWPTMFAKSSCAINPILYFLTNPTFLKNKRLCFTRTRTVDMREQEMQSFGKGGKRFVSTERCTNTGIEVNDKFTTI